MSDTPTEGGDALTEGRQHGTGVASRLDDDTLQELLRQYENSAARAREQAAYLTGAALAMANTLAARQRAAQQTCPEWDADMCARHIGHTGDHQDGGGHTWPQDPVIT
jgi:hypothetical protein